MSIPLGGISIRNGTFIAYRGGVFGTISYGTHSEFDVARRIMGLVKENPDLRPLLDAGWTNIDYTWEGVKYTIYNSPQGLQVLINE